MEQVFTTDYLNDKIMDQLSPRDLNNVRSSSKKLQGAVSIHSNEKMKHYCDVVNRKVSRLDTSNIIHMYDMKYNIIYNYYHTVIVYKCMVLEDHLSPAFSKLMITFHTKKRILFGYTFSLNDGCYHKNLPEKRSFTLYNIMSNIYLENKGNYLIGKAFTTDNMELVKFLQGKLLPL